MEFDGDMSREEYAKLPPEEREAYQRAGNQALREFAEQVNEHAEALVVLAKDAVENGLAFAAMNVGIGATMLLGETQEMLSAVERSEAKLDELGIEGAEAAIAQEEAEAKASAAQSGGGILGPGGNLL